mmetsp:Transcript_44235/g.72005  ORF Transcript_44235/g.72005 Transcript_44235/m.72005 type:complete len:232 (+) Transcript_44235:109-804(+)|eukprot:CAMPEP_0184647504 /NCGR_PEP_ID=MMETSP0308-20130426/4447_1 /TAXON_ID=38269 /ORGANISM="Gloeochaete witrockiana, Strain SAG 46.84" /LENGTH=231 /DNA_ID=CAMNT_0027078521 /DNA_START=78 /DNA_END=773 /DNA_ORIENTATION=-
MALSTPVKLVAGGWLAFAGSHLVLSHPPVRRTIIDKIGQGPFLGLYSLVAFGTLLPTSYVYYKYGRTAGPRLWDLSPSPVMTASSHILRLLGVMNFGQAFATPSPSGLGDPNKPVDPSKPRGLVRITRHGLFMSFALIGVGNLISSGGMLGPVVFWGGFPLFWIIGSLHQDYRQRQTMPKSYYEQTSLLPFAAIIEGRNSLSEAIKEMNPRAAGISASLYAAYLAQKLLRK